MAAQYPQNALNFVCELEFIAPSQQYYPCFVDGRWKPPRPRGSNVPSQQFQQSSWYQYRPGGMTWITRPNVRGLQPYQIFSAYFDDNFVWLYPSDATRHQVGDGSGNLRRDGQAQHLVDDDDEPNVDNGVEQPHHDWSPLSFDWIGNRGTSFATFRGPQPRLKVGNPQQLWIDRLIPRAQHPRILGQQGLGGLNGRISILLALVAASVENASVQDAMSNCFQRPYNPPMAPAAVNHRRGMVIRVFVPASIDSQTASANLWNFEQGNLGTLFP